MDEEWEQGICGILAGENEMINPVSIFQNDAMQMLRERRSEIEQRMKSGEIQPTTMIGGNAYTDIEWNKLLERMDTTLEKVKEEQKERFARIDAEQAQKAILKKIEEEKSNVPYSYLAKDGFIEYNGVVFTCDEEHHAICLGDMTNEEEVIRIPLTEGGCLKVNRNNLSELSKAISMFSPSDIRRIMEAIARDAKCEQMKLQLEEDSDSVGESAEAKMDSHGADVVTAEQVSLLLKDREQEKDL